MSDIDSIITQLERRRASIETALEALRGLSGDIAIKRGPGRPQGSGQKRTGMSSEGRKRQAEAMRAYWAARKAGAKKPAKKAAKKGGLTAAGRKTLSENMKRMWAEKKLGRKAS